MEEFARKCIKKEQVLQLKARAGAYSVCAWFFYVHNNLILLISPFYYKLQHKSVTGCWTAAVRQAKDWGSEMENNNSVWRRDGRGEGEEGGVRGEDICKSLQESARTNAVLPWR